MTINKTQNGEITTFALDGRLDTTTSPSLQEVLIPEFNTATQVDLDFTELKYVSSAGLRVLLMGEKTAKAKGAKMTLRNVSKDIMEVFQMTGFSDILRFE